MDKVDLISHRFSRAKLDRAWSFHGYRSGDQWSHAYHRYPARFIPELVNKLIDTYSKENDTIADFFAGCGTTLVESKIHGRKSIGIDINPVARLITKAKINAIHPNKLEHAYESLERDVENYSYNKDQVLRKHKRIDYWFRKREKQKIAFLYSKILRLEDSKTRDFFLCALSNILKNCSKWLQSSTKPQIDPKKKPADPFELFPRHSSMMMRKNKEFYDTLSERGYLDAQCSIKTADARKTGLPSSSIGIIITSPPYVTSYEYADIHQLTGYWFDYVEDISSFRKRFIGTFFSNNQNLTTRDEMAQRIVNNLCTRDKKVAREVARYFEDMYDVAVEMKRVLRKRGRLCLVIGNTTMRGVKIRSAETFVSTLKSLDFRIEKIIRRTIPHKYKSIPTIRDKKTGRFSKLSSKNSKLVYPNEYIIVARK